MRRKWMQVHWCLRYEQFLKKKIRKRKRKKERENERGGRKKKGAKKDEEKPEPVKETSCGRVSLLEPALPFHVQYHFLRIYNNSAFFE